MASNKKNAAKRNAAKKAPQKNDDLIVYQVLLALIAGTFAFIFARFMQRYFIQDILGFYDMIRVFFPVVGGLTVLAVLLAVFGRKKKLTRRLGIGLAIGFGALAVGSGLMRFLFENAFPLVFFLYIAAPCVYCLYLLYQREFFWISTVTASAGFVFYHLSKTADFGISKLSMLMMAAVIVLLLAVAVLTFLAQRRGGQLKIGKWTALQLSAPLPGWTVYLTCAIWLVCLIAVPLLGSLFSYCCMFAAMALELLAACYFTIKLM